MSNGGCSRSWNRSAARTSRHCRWYGGASGSSSSCTRAIFYPALLRVGVAARRQAGAEAETLDAIRDHNEIRDAVGQAARHPVGSPDWHAAVAAANLANSDHMAEEEREGLTDFRRLAGAAGTP
jgi:hypothetical protein